MGKAQSKRSVDITTETKKAVDNEVTEKMEKIEDVDKKDSNGEASVPEKKGESEDLENDKDTTTEKCTDLQLSGNSTQEVKAPDTEQKNDDGTSEEISPLSDENGVKKSKKEKVKKKWSFRSISFGKKDKQKPGKTDENTENNSATANGIDEDETSRENEESQKEQGSEDNSPDVKIIDENGSTTEADRTEKHTEENSVDMKSIEDDTANTTKHSINESNDLVKNDIAAIGSLTETENSLNVTASCDKTKSDSNSEENAVDETSANGNNIEESNSTEQLTTAGENVCEVAAENENIPADVKIEAVAVNGTVEEIHQNGTNDVCTLEDDQKKAQTEVNINTLKTSAETLDTLSSSTSNIPSKNPINFQNLNTLGETLDDVGVDNDVKTQENCDVSELGSKNCESYKDENIKEEVKVSTSEKFGDEHCPPPLPISPPPSQVTVFAFTNNEDPVENSLKKTEVISTQVEESTMSENSSHETCNTNTSSDIKTFESCNDTNVDTIYTPEEEIDAEQKCGEKNFDKKEQSGTIDIDQMQSCIDIDNSKSRNSEVMNYEDNAVNECLGNNEDLAVNESTQLPNGEPQVESSLLDAKIELSVDTNIIPGDNHEAEIGKVINLEHDAVNADNVNFINENVNNSADPSSSIILVENDADNDCLRPLNSQDKVEVEDNIISNKIDNLDREETKEFADPKDLKERATIAEVKQDPPVTCE